MNSRIGYRGFKQVILSEVVRDRLREKIADANAIQLQIAEKAEVSTSRVNYLLRGYWISEKIALKILSAIEYFVNNPQPAVPATTTRKTFREIPTREASLTFLLVPILTANDLLEGRWLAGRPL